MPYWQIFHEVGIENGQRIEAGTRMDQRKSKGCGCKSGNDVLPDTGHRERDQEAG
jgi:hypothetical protein